MKLTCRRDQNVCCLLRRLLLSRRDVTWHFVDDKRPPMAFVIVHETKTVRGSSERDRWRTCNYGAGQRNVVSPIIEKAALCGRMGQGAAPIVWGGGRADCPKRFNATSSYVEEEVRGEIFYS